MAPLKSFPGPGSAKSWEAGAHQVAGQVSCYGLLDWESCRYLTYGPCRTHKLVLEQLSTHAMLPTTDTPLCKG